jgi:hypothetical protein
MGAKRIVVIINKAWEASAIAGIFRSPYDIGVAAGPLQPAAGLLYPSLQDQNTGGSWFHFSLAFGARTVALCCLADFKDTYDSGRKFTFVPQILGAGPGADILIAFGTGASIDRNQNGTVSSPNLCAVLEK